MGVDCEASCLWHQNTGFSSCEPETIKALPEAGVTFAGWVGPESCSGLDPGAECVIPRAYESGPRREIQTVGHWQVGSEGATWRKTLSRAARHELIEDGEGHLTLLSGDYHPFEVVGLEGPERGALLISLTADGESVRWHQTIRTRSTGEVFWPKALTLNAAGQLVVLGVATGDLDLEGGEPSGVADGEMRLVVMKLSADGTLLWTRYLHRPELGSVSNAELVLAGEGEAESLVVVSTIGIRLGEPQEAEKTSYQGWLLDLKGDGEERWQLDFVHDFPLKATAKLGGAFVDSAGDVHLVHGLSLAHSPSFEGDWTQIVKEKRDGRTGELLDARFMTRGLAAMRPLLVGAPDDSWAYFGGMGSDAETMLVSFGADGIERWKAPVGLGEGRWLLVEPETLDVFLGGGRGPLELFRYEASGALLWSERGPLVNAHDMNLTPGGAILSVGESFDYSEALMMRFEP